MSNQLLQGKGIWARPRSGGPSELERAVQIALQVGATHVLYKVAQGATYLQGSAQAAQRITDAGLIPLGWMWLILNDPAGEAQAVARAFQDGFQGLVFNVEDPCSRKFEPARTLTRAIREAGLDVNRLYNCSFPNISAHQDLPYTELNQVCKGGLMPMAYGSFFAPGDPTPWETQAQRVIDQWAYGHYELWCARWGYRPPIYPVLGPYHNEYGTARMEAAEFQVWLDRLAAHSPTFFSVYTAAVIGDSLLPLIRAFPLGEQPREEPGVPDRVWVRTLSGALLYRLPDTSSLPLRAVAYGTLLEGLAWRRVGPRRWLQVRTADGSPCWVAEEALAWANPGPPPALSAPPPAPAGQVTHVWATQEVNYRSRPAVRSDTLIGRLYPGARLRVVEDPALAHSKVGVSGQWLNVQLDPDGPPGWVAAWYVTDHPPLYEAPPPLTHVRVASSIGLSVRAGSTTNAAKVWHVPDGTVLEVAEDLHEAAAKVGVADQWVRVRTPSLHEGYVSAEYLRADVPPDNRQPASDAVLPFGEAAWIFGIHGAGAAETADFRYLFQGTGKTGWVLFTEGIGHNPAALSPNEPLRQKLWGWARSGFGVILRLNNGYGTAGTLPDSVHYQAFAATCARFCELYLKHPEVPQSHYTWIIVIGNEQNNVREHPGGEHSPREHITPQLYARAFNLAYQAIKAVLPNATVVPGAVDPYNTWPWVLAGNLRYRPLTYFKEMLEGIEQLDGFALHCYTHGPVKEYITHKKVFTDPPLNPGTEHEHYYDFQAYRPFIEAIPPRWRDRPVYITESNHWVVNPDGTPPAGWVNQNTGWVRAAYEEIHRWNTTPHAQQIHCLLLYRWQGDEWAIDVKDQVQADFRMALARDYRWRR